MRLALALVLLVACGSEVPSKPKPKATLRHDWKGLAPLPTDRIAEEIAWLSLKKCGKILEVDVIWMPDQFYCLTMPVMGCATPSTTWVAWRPQIYDTVLAHELVHEVYYLCGDDSDVDKSKPDQHSDGFYADWLEVMRRLP